MLNIGMTLAILVDPTSTPSSLATAYLHITPRSRAREMLEFWKEQGHKLHLITVAQDTDKEGEARLWLLGHDFGRFFAYNGRRQRQKRLFFCRQHEDKRQLCLDARIDVMIGTDANNLLLLVGAVQHLILFGATQAPEGMIPAPHLGAVAEAVQTIHKRSQGLDPA